MDQATKRQLKQNDRFVATGEQGLEWARENKKPTIIAIAIAVLGIAIIAIAIGIYQHRSAAANQAFGAAMQTYNTPLASAAHPLAPGEKSFPDAKSRASQATAEFLSVANQYGAERDGKLARYFAGLTQLEAGQNGAAEASLKTVSNYWNKDLSALGKLALAELYRSQGQNAQAESLYKDLADGHATTVTPGMAQIDLAELYEAEGKTAEARSLYAQLKDKDKGKNGKEGPIGALAAEKLNPTAATPTGQPSL